MLDTLKNLHFGAMNIGENKNMSLADRREHPARVLQTGNISHTIKSKSITENIEISGIHNKCISPNIRLVSLDMTLETESVCC